MGFSWRAPRIKLFCSSSRWLNKKLPSMAFFNLANCSGVLWCTGAVQLSSVSAAGFRDSAETDVRRLKLYCAGYESALGGLLSADGGPSNGESPPKGLAPKGPLKAGPALFPNVGPVGDATTSSSSSITFCIFPDPKGLELDPNGLVKVGLDMLGDRVSVVFRNDSVELEARNAARSEASRREKWSAQNCRISVGFEDSSCWLRASISFR